MWKKDLGGTSAWEAISLSIVLVFLAALIWYSRRETIAVIPFVIQLFRLSQAVSLVAINPSNVCSAQPVGFAALLVVFPVFTGLADYLNIGHSPLQRFSEQLSFTFVYLLALLVTPVILALRAWNDRRTGRNDRDEIAPGLAARRAVVIWFWLLLATLLYIATGQWLCVHRESRGLDRTQAGAHPTAGRHIYNYYESECGPKVSAYVMTCSLGLALLLVILAMLALTIRRVAKLSRSGDAELTAYQQLSFLYGHCRPDCIRWWVLDLLVTAVAWGHRSFGHTTIDGAIAILLLLGLMAAAIVKRPFATLLSNLAFVVGTFTVVLAVALRITLMSCIDIDNPLEPGIYAVEHSASDPLSIAVVVFYGVTVILYAVCAWKSRAQMGQVKYFDGYTNMNSDLLSTTRDKEMTPTAVGAGHSDVAGDI